MPEWLQWILEEDLRAAGVENPLYSREKSVYLELGDAKETLMRLMTGIA